MKRIFLLLIAFFCFQIVFSGARTSAHAAVNRQLFETQEPPPPQIVVFYPDSSGIATVNWKSVLSIPDSIVTYTGPARIKMNVVISDFNAVIKKVQFYAGNTLLHTEDQLPFGFLGVDVPVGPSCFFELAVKF